MTDIPKFKWKRHTPFTEKFDNEFFINCTLPPDGKAKLVRVVNYLLDKEITPNNDATILGIAIYSFLFRVMTSSIDSQELEILNGYLKKAMRIR